MLERDKLSDDMTMPLRSLSALTAASLLALSSCTHQGYCSPVPTQPVQSFDQLLRTLAANPPDSCATPITTDAELDAVEASVFAQAGTLVTQALNATADRQGSPQDRATEELKKLERTSSELNASWPDENRFHFQLIDLAPTIVLKMTIRTHARFFVFGIPASVSGEPRTLWQQVGSDQETSDHPAPRSWVDIYPLHRGPSGNPRFLAAFGFTGCAGSSGLVYDGEEWGLQGPGWIEQVLKQEGAWGMDEVADGQPTTKKDPFKPIGKLETEGSTIRLPFCWFSAIDTWDNPSLCAVDTYDLSGDEIKFRSRTYNRPDLLPIASAIEYAEKRDYPAIRAYCANTEVAHKMIRDLPPFFFTGDLQVLRKGDEKEIIDMDSYRSVVEKRNGRWLVVEFGEKN